MRNLFRVPLKLQILKSIHDVNELKSKKSIKRDNTT